MNSARRRSDPSAAFLEDRRQLFALTLGGASFARAYSALVDAWLRTLLGATPDVALSAVGALGRERAVSRAATSTSS